jgi:hypothetical protein
LKATARADGPESRERVATDVERFDRLGFGVTLLGDTLDAGFSVQEWRAPRA